jgi:hypothetical protein
MTTHSLFVSVAFGIVLTLISTTLIAGGGKLAYGNPTGDPAEDTYQTPYANVGEDGRILVFCAEDELLVITPVDSGAAEASCQPTE